ncbi:MAG TPA: Gfo/Idh/MocA family oxidoreductase [Gaiellaceae bacterium]|nr:Gfo/Idh/MocA family oxidoreductase [Gaiellaceae bacterium]
MRVAIVGAGNIADRYADTILAQGEPLELAGSTDLDPARAEAFAARYGGRAYASLDELLGDESVDTVVNLTIPLAHAEVTRAALEAGKHVHSEKPLALSYAEAHELVELARRRGVRLSSAPATLLGEAQQSAWKLVRDGAIGRVRVVYAEANWDRLERWHPDPRGLYAVGPLVDVGIYPLAIMTAMFGPARRVRAYATTVEPTRTHRKGWTFELETPDFVVAVLELEDGVVARLTANFYVPASKQRGLELHGDAGSLYMPTWGEFNSRLELQERNGEYATVPPLREPYDGIDWARPLVDLAEAIEEGRPHRASGEHAAHLVEVLEAAKRSADEGGEVDVGSTFTRPEPLSWSS